MALMGLLPAAPALAHYQAGVPVSLTPAQAEVAVGQTVDIAVTVSNVTDLYGIDVSLSFDPALIEVVDADPNLPGVQVALGLFLDSGFVLRNEADNTAGTLRFAMTQLNPSQPKSGSGHLLVVKLRGKQLAASTALVLAEVQLAQNTGTLLPVTTTGGQVAVVGASAGPTATAIPTQGAGTPLPTGTLVEPTQGPTLAVSSTPLPTQTPLPATATPTRAAGAAPTLAAPEVTPTASASAAPNTPAAPDSTATPSSSASAADTQASTAIAAAPQATSQPAATLGGPAATQPSAQPGGLSPLVLVGLGLVVLAAVGGLVLAAAKQK